jgi:hypothetical protein
MSCPSYSFESPEGLKFCHKCGAPLRLPCAQYGLANPPQAKFCSECAAALPSQIGASTTLLLARCGYRVLLVNRATFLSDTLSTHLVQQAGVLWLNCWGLLDEIIASSCPSIVQRLSDFGDFPPRVRRRSMANRRPMSRARPPPTRQGITDAFQGSPPSGSCSCCPSSCGSRARRPRSRWRPRTMRLDMPRRVYALVRLSKGARVHARLPHVSSCTPVTHREATLTTHVTRRRLPARETASPLG